jgi:hypothetical protein
MLEQNDFRPLSARNGQRRDKSPERGSVFGSNNQADARIRTADPFITSEVLYQLSYVGGAAQV